MIPRVKIVTAQTMRELDRRAMEQGGIPGAVLMENAGRAVFDQMAARYGPLCRRRVLVACGTGNNGGDGFVAARWLRLSGAEVFVTLVGDPARLHGDAQVHYGAMRGMGIAPVAEASVVDLRVDAILGTGLAGPPR